MSSITRAVEVFVDRLATLGWGAIALGAFLHVLKMAARARAWRNVIAEAYPDADVRWRRVFGAYAAGVGVNSILPARGGDVLRLYLARRGIEGSTYPTLGATLLVEAIFDSVVASALLLWALSLGVLPGLDVLPRLPSIDWLWLFHNPELAWIFGGLLALAVIVAFAFARAHVVAFRERVAQGVVILRRPRRYLRLVVAWQAVDWSLRLATIYCFLRGFGLAADLHNVLLVQVSQSVSTILPLTPAGLGTEQALLLYVFRGTAPIGAVLSFSVGMKAVLIAVNVVVGFTAILLMLRTFRWRGRMEA
jgi:uncharacterized membrane protein YbhN (UPF0104 family)